MVRSTLGITYFYATGSLFIARNVVVARRSSSGRRLVIQPRAFRAGSTFCSASPPSSAATAAAVLLAGEKQPIRAFTAGINIKHCPQEHAALPSLPHSPHTTHITTYTYLSEYLDDLDRALTQKQIYTLNYAHFVFVYLKEDVPIDVR